MEADAKGEPSAMIVLKFGGTSVRNAEWIDRAIDITFRQGERAPVLVASAMGDTTDDLLSAAEDAAAGNRNKAKDTLASVRRHHVETARAFLTGDNLAACVDTVEGYLKELGSMVTGLALLREITPRSRDLILSFGERLSTLLIAHRAWERGLAAELLDTRELIKTDDSFGHAIPIEELTNRLIREKVHPAAGRVLICQGFIASTVEGITSTLGRGGSDYTATIIGAALGAEEVQIWTDVTGIMTADPRRIKRATTIPRITFQEAAELAYFGARVIHPSTIQPAVASAIPVWVRNTGRPEAQGTCIVASLDAEGPKAVASKEPITVISVSSGRMLLAYGFLKRIFEIFERFETSVDLIATSEVSVSVTIDDDHALPQITRELESLGGVQVERDKSIICLVGQDLWKDSATIARVFASLKEIPIRLISLGSSDTNLSLVVPRDRTEEAVGRLHQEFFEPR
jgi:aspartate kinase